MKNRKSKIHKIIFPSFYCSPSKGPQFKVYFICGILCLIFNISLGIIRDDILLNDDNYGGCRQEEPAIASNNTNSGVICWTDFRDGNADIYVQRIDSFGNPIDANFRANTDAGIKWQGTPSVAMHASGDFAIVWEDRRNCNSDVYCQKFNAQGIPIDTNFRVNDDIGTTDQRNADIIIQPNQNIVVVWDDWRNDWGDIYGQIFNAQLHPIGINFRINNDNFGNTQYAPSIAQDSLGNFIVTWMDSRNGHWDIYAQRFNSQGIPIGNNFRVNDDLTTTDQYSPQLACFSNGQFALVWEDSRTGNNDIYLQRFDAFGNRIGSNMRVNDDLGNAVQMLPDIAFDRFGNFIITWTDNRNGNFDIFAQRYDSLGLTIGQNFQVNDDSSNQDQAGSCIAINSQNEFIIVWSDKREMNTDIYYQKYNHLGNIIGQNIRLNDDNASSHQRCSWICQTGAGNYIVTWEDERNTSTDIYAVRLDSLGNILCPNFKVNDDFTNQDQFYASVTANFDGDFTIAWTDGRNGNFDIYAQKYSRTGVSVGNNYQVNDDNSNQTQWYPVLASDSIGNIIIVWIDYRNNNPDIYGQLYDYLGNPLGNNFIINESSEATQLYPFVARSLSGTFIVAWMDNRNSNFDIYAQRFDNLGNAIGSNFKVNDDIGTAFQGYPAVAINSTGDFIIVWEDKRNGNTDIYLQRFNNNGIPMESNIKVNNNNLTEQYSPTVSYSEDGKFVVVWCGLRNNNDLDIFSQAYSDNGMLIANNRQINNPDLFSGNNQWLIGQSVVANSRRINFAWTDNRRHQGWDIYSKIVDWNFFTGISDNVNNNHYILNRIKIFPNPSNGKIFINHERSITNLRIFNSIGQQVKNIKFSNSSMLDFSELNTGIYFIQYETKQKSMTEKIVITK
ncbi:MAG: T9SS type A sorting domain-containing protein [candidate division WOR-3 bacterium]